MSQSGPDSGVYLIEHEFWLADSTNSIDQWFLLITDPSDGPKNQFKKL